MKPIAIFDIDGTIFRSSLMIELFKHLVRKNIFPKSSMAKIQNSEQKWLNRKGHYSEFVSDVVEAYHNAIKRKKRSDIIAASREVIREQKHRTYRFTLALLRKLKKRYLTIAISGSPFEAVREYNKFLKFDKFYAEEFGVNEKGIYTGKILHMPTLYKRELVVRYVQNHNLSFKNSIGVGDTETDIGFLDLVQEPVAFNPNNVLARYARKKNWKIVIERKDLVIEFNPKKVKFLRV
ncbi:MAG: HAD-IB family phosphatase [Candidatus Doudnabacteria bacterium]|nr:HAD-IB family phosphatase [Candidatus Doudnabacteria bacterium]